MLVHAVRKLAPPEGELMIKGPAATATMTLPGRDPVAWRLPAAGGAHMQIIRRQPRRSAASEHAGNRRSRANLLMDLVSRQTRNENQCCRQHTDMACYAVHTRSGGAFGAESLGVAWTYLKRISVGGKGALKALARTTVQT